MWGVNFAYMRVCDQERFCCITVRHLTDFSVFLVALVESNSRPGGMQLVNAKTVNKNSDPMDLVELAKSVQKVGVAFERM